VSDKMEDSKSLNDKVKQFEKARKKELALSQKLDEIKKERMELEEELYITFENEDCSLIRFHGTTFYPYIDMYASIAENDREEGYGWLEEMGAGGLIKPSLNSKKFSSWIKELQKQEEHIPKFVKIFTKKKIGMRKGK